jgi:antitoxin component YwqK of YwqJK toxin-antitoxin module
MMPSSRRGRAALTAVAVAVAAGVAAIPRPAGAFQRCAVGEKSINLDNGASTEGLTGKVICRDADSGKVEREIPYVKGKEEGVEVTMTFDGKRLETTYRAGKKHGLRRAFGPDGKLLEETHFVDDDELGEGRTFYADGKVKTRVVRRQNDVETLRFEYDESGRLVDLRCGSQVSIPIGRHPCQYEKRTEVVRLFHPNGKPKEVIPLAGGLREGASQRLAADGRPAGVMTFKAGKLSGISEERTEAGQLARRVSYADGELDGPDERFFADGKLAERAVYSHGRRQSVLRMWQNGQKRSMLTIKDGDKAELLEELFDNGKPKSIEPSVWGPNRWGGEGMRLHGQVKRWWESGHLASDEVYANGELDGPSTHYFENGQVELAETWKAGRATSRKQWDEHGKLLKDERYNEDGSRQ